MTSIFKRFSAGFVAVAIAGAVLASSLPIIAQESAGSGLRISPTRTDLTLVPGDSREVIQTVKNVTQNAITVQPVLNDFESDGSTGEPVLLGDPDQKSAYSLREFITVPDSFDLAADEEREVKIAVTVPEKASAGAYFGSVLYRASPQGSSGDGQVALVASVGSLILLEVPGEITEKIQINNISAFIDNKAGSLFTKKPDQIGVEIQNLGNSFSQPFGKVAVKDWRGNDVFVYELNDGSPRLNVLPDSTRLFTQELFNVEVKSVNGVEEIEKNSPLTWPGRYTVSANISHGSTGEIYTVSSTFWYIPIQLIAVAVALLAGLVLVTVMLYKKHVTKSTNRKK